MEDQWVNWESNLRYVRVGRCKKKLKCKFNVLMVILRERHLQHSTLQLNTFLKMYVIIYMQGVAKFQKLFFCTHLYIAIHFNNLFPLFTNHTHDNIDVIYMIVWCIHFAISKMLRYMSINFNVKR